MKNLIKAFAILLVGAALGMFLQIAPSLLNLSKQLPLVDLLHIWLSLVGVYLYLSIPVLVVTGLILSLVLSRTK